MHNIQDNGVSESSQGLTMGRGDARETFGELRKGPPFHGPRSCRAVEVLDASCQIGGHAVTGR